MKLKWKLGDKPTGRFRSFGRRSWPMGYDDAGSPAANLVPRDRDVSYTPAVAETTELDLYVAKWSGTQAEINQYGAWRWVRLMRGGKPATAVGVTAAKKVCEEYLTR